MIKILFIIVLTFFPSIAVSKEKLGKVADSLDFVILTDTNSIEVKTGHRFRVYKNSRTVYFDGDNVVLSFPESLEVDWNGATVEIAYYKDFYRFRKV